MLINKLTAMKLQEIQPFEYKTFTLAGISFGMEVIPLSRKPQPDEYAVRFTAHNFVGDWMILQSTDIVIGEFSYEAAKAIAQDHDVSIQLVPSLF